MTSQLVVVSGLPASGKTTMGALLSRRLSMPLIDKDAILEEMFDTVGCANEKERSRLSRASDEVLYALAATSPAAVLVNWWDRESAPARLRDITPSVVEVFCHCPIDVAAARFMSRARHPGHRDWSRSSTEIRQSFDRLGTAFPKPLGIGHVLRVDTELDVDADVVVRQVRGALDAVAPRA